MSEKRRGKLEIINDMLQSIKNKGGQIKPTHLLYKSNLSHSKMKVYLKELTEKGMVEEHMKKDKELWSGCISGAETMQNYLDIMKNSGFFGMQILKRYTWKEIEGIKFISVVVKGHKLNRSKECVYKGDTATYIGPLKNAEDDEGHIFLRGIPQEVCTETAKRLSKQPYDKIFTITYSTKNMVEGKSCAPNGGCC